MKKMSLLLGTSAIILSLGVFAAPQGFQSGPTGPAVQGFNPLEPTTVKNIIQSAYDDQHVVLKGRLIGQIDGELFEFKDAAGDVIVVELDNDWTWDHIAKDQLIDIYGKVDRDYNFVKIDVKSARASAN